MTATSQRGLPRRVLITCVNPARLLAWARQLPPGALTVTNAFHGTSRLQFSTDAQPDMPIEFVITTDSSSVADLLVPRGKKAVITPNTLEFAVGDTSAEDAPAASPGPVRANLLDAVRTLCQHIQDHPDVSGDTVRIAEVAITPRPLGRHGLHMPPWRGNHTVVPCGSIGELLVWYQSIQHDDVSRGRGPELILSRPDAHTIHLRLVAVMDASMFEVHADASMLIDHIALSIGDTRPVRAQRLATAMAAAAAASAARHQSVMAALGSQTSPPPPAGPSPAADRPAESITNSSGET